MTAVNMHEAKTQLSRLVAAAEAGETVVIAKAGHPVVKITRLDARETPQRLGFLAGDAVIPDDFDTMGAGDIVALFENLG